MMTVIIRYESSQSQDPGLQLVFPKVDLDSVSVYLLGILFVLFLHFATLRFI